MTEGNAILEDYGVLSILPPALCIGLVLYTRNIIISLSFSALIGTLILSGYNPFFAVSSLMEAHIFEELATGSNIQVLVAILAIGGFVQLLNKSDGTAAFSMVIVKFISTSTKAQLAAWYAGISVFFTDIGNSLIIGPLFRPVFHRLKICREKLAYIIDTTSAPVSILVPFIGWGVYIMGLIENSYQDLGINNDSFSVLLNVWPYQFYALLALTSIPMVLSTGKDFGPMAKAQLNYHQSNTKHSFNNETKTKKVKLSIILLPLLVMLVTMAIYISYFAYKEGMQSVHVRGALAVSYILAAIVCAYLMKKYKKTTYQESINHFIRGMEKLVLVCLILTLAWAFSSIIKELHTGQYLASLIGDSINPNFLPLFVFLIGAVISFASGSSYGTFAILMVIVLPVAHELQAPMILTIAAILSGGLFGDHTSPISDTTLLASIGADCPHIDHITTQLPYAMITGLMTVLAFIIAGFYPSPFIVIAIMIIQFITITSLMKLYGHK